jgi:hypothetical protein
VLRRLRARAAPSLRWGGGQQGRKPGQQRLHIGCKVCGWRHTDMVVAHGYGCML